MPPPQPATQAYRDGTGAPAYRAENGTQAYRDVVGATAAYVESLEPANNQASGPRPTHAPTPSGRPTRSAWHDLGVGDSVELSGTTLRIEKILSGDGQSGEAVVYLTRDESNRERVLKLYRDFNNNPKAEPNPDALARIARITDPDILRLHSYGTGTRKFRGRFCYEISDLARGGTLLEVPSLEAKYTADFVKREVVPQILLGLKRLHRASIYHCDLKPQNIFYLDSKQVDLVIGDYGSAKTKEEGRQNRVSHTSMVKGTSHYLAPEQPYGIVSEKNDFFSFGMVLVHLLYPRVMDKAGLGMMRERITNRKPIVDFRREHAEIASLIGGLTLHDPHARWGESEVERWLVGDISEVRYGGAFEPLKLSATVVIHTKAQLAAHIEDNQSWHRDLIDDPDGFSLLKHWIGRLLDHTSMKSFDRMVRFYQQDGIPYVQEAVLRFLEPERPLVMKFLDARRVPTADVRVHDLWDGSDLVEAVAKVIRDIDDRSKCVELDVLKLNMFRLELALRTLAADEANPSAVGARLQCDRITGKLGLAASDPADHGTSWHPAVTWKSFLQVAYEFDPSRGLRDQFGSAFSTPEDVGLLFAGDQSSFGDA